MAVKKVRKRAKKILTAEKLTLALSAGDLEPVYYFRAADDPPRGMNKDKSPFNDYLMDKALNQIRQNVVDGNLKDFNYSMFVAPDNTIESAIEVARTYPMMRDRRLVIVKDAHLAKADDWAYAINYLDDPSPTTVLVFIAVHYPNKSRGGLKAKAAVLENACCVRFAPFNKIREVQPFLRAELNARKMKMDRQAESALLELVGTDLNLLVQALEKLQLFQTEKSTISGRDVEYCIAKTKVEDIWSFYDGLAERQLGKALGAALKLLENTKPEEAPIFIASLIRLYDDLLSVRMSIDTGLSNAQLIKKVGGNSWAAEKRIKQARRSSTSILSRTIGYLGELDRQIRLSPVDKHRLIEQFVMRACSL